MGLKFNESPTPPRGWARWVNGAKLIPIKSPVIKTLKEPTEVGDMTLVFGSPEDTKLIPSGSAVVRLTGPDGKAEDIQLAETWGMPGKKGPGLSSIVPLAQWANRQSGIKTAGLTTLVIEVQGALEITHPELLGLDPAKHYTLEITA